MLIHSLAFFYIIAVWHEASMLNYYFFVLHRTEWRRIIHVNSNVSISGQQQIFLREAVSFCQRKRCLQTARWSGPEGLSNNSRTTYTAITVVGPCATKTHRGQQEYKSCCKGTGGEEDLWLVCKETDPERKIRYCMLSFGFKLFEVGNRIRKKCNNQRTIYCIKD